MNRRKLVCSRRPRRCALLRIGAVSACGSVRRMAHDDHAVQRPARTDDGRARGGVREADGDQGQRPHRRRGRTRQPDHPGGLELAGRRLLHREHARCSKHCASRVCWPPWRRVDPGGRPRPLQLRAGRLGRRVGTRLGARLQHLRRSTPSQLPSSILELAEPKWKGKVGFAPSETDFQPLITSITKLDGTAAAEHWLKGLQANSKIYPDNETVVAQVNNGESAVGLINHYYWYRLRDEIGAGAMHSALHYYAPGDPGDLVNVSGAAVLKSSYAPGRGAERSWRSWSASAGQETIAHSQSYEYPLRPGVAPAAGPAPVRPAASPRR